MGSNRKDKRQIKNISKERRDAMSKKFSEMHKGKAKTKSHKDKISKALIKRAKIRKEQGLSAFSDQHRENISESHKGKKATEKTKQKMSIARKGPKNAMYGRHHSKETILKMQNNKLGKSLSKKHAESISKAYTEDRKIEQSEMMKKLWKSGDLQHVPKWNGKHTEEAKQAMSKSQKEIWKNMSYEDREKRCANHGKSHKGKKLSAQHISKIRQTTVKQIKDRQCHGLPMMPAIGKHETQILDSIEICINKKIERQHEVLGYFLDGYIKDLNCAIEIDEAQHFGHNGNLSEKDICRQKEIEKYLGCKFIRIPDLQENHSQI